MWVWMFVCFSVLVLRYVCTSAQGAPCLWYSHPSTSGTPELDKELRKGWTNDRWRRLIPKYYWDTLCFYLTYCCSTEINIPPLDDIIKQCNWNSYVTWMNLCIAACQSDTFTGSGIHCNCWNLQVNPGNFFSLTGDWPLNTDYTDYTDYTLFIAMMEHRVCANLTFGASK